MSRKGVTPVIATVLLITISIAATSTAYTFIMNAQQSAKDSYEERFSQKEIERRTDLNIEHIYEESSSGNAILVIRNTGSLTQRVEEDGTKYWALYADGEPIGPSDSGTTWDYVDSSLGGNVNLNPQATMAINSNVEFPSGPSGEKEFRIVGRYGSQDSIICAPGSSNSC